MCGGYLNWNCSHDSECSRRLYCIAGSCQCKIVVGNENYWNSSYCVPAGALNQPCTIGNNQTCRMLTNSLFCSPIGTCISSLPLTVNQTCTGSFVPCDASKNLSCIGDLCQCDVGSYWNVTQDACF